MSLVSINTAPSLRELRWFGLVMGLFLTTLGAVVSWKFQRPQLLWGFATAAVLFIFLYYSIRPIQKPLFAWWNLAVYPIGWTVSHLTLVVVFYLVLAPIGLLLRMAGYDAMKRRRETTENTYWDQLHQKDKTSVEQYFRQF